MTFARRCAALVSPAALNILAGLIVIADQASKWLVQRLVPEHSSLPLLGDYLRLTFVHNSGAAFGILQQQRVFLVLITFAAVGAMLWYRRTLAAGDWLPRLGLSLIVGGALGNLIDRVALGRVVDFIDADFPDIMIGPYSFFGQRLSFACERWPAFNIADSAISTGLCLLVWHLWNTDDSPAATAPPAAADSAPATLPDEVR